MDVSVRLAEDDLHQAAGAVERDLVRDVPLARKLLTGKPNNICYQDAYESDAPIEKRMKFRMIADAKGNSDVHGVWSWSLGSRNLWLVQAVCSHAGILNSPVILFDSGTGGSGSIYLLGGEAQEAAGLNKDFDPMPHEAVLRIRPSLLDDRWLLIAAPAGKSAAIIDLEAPAEPIILHNLKDTFAVAGRCSVKRRAAARAAQHGWSLLRLPHGRRRPIDLRPLDRRRDGSRDGAWLLRRFVRGRTLHPRRIFRRGRHLFAGAVREGAEATGYRQGRVAGKIQDGPELTLQVPPNIAMELAREGGALAARMQIRAGTGLKAVRLFDDGELVKEIALQGRTATPTASFEQPLKGRWLAAIAEDHERVVQRSRADRQSRAGACRAQLECRGRRRRPLRGKPPQAQLRAVRCAPIVRNATVPANGVLCACRCDGAAGGTVHVGTGPSSQPWKPSCKRQNPGTSSSSHLPDTACRVATDSST